jgi:putative acetyltransferase
MKPAPVLIRPEIPGDHPLIADLVTTAFKTVAESSGTEAGLVERLRQRPEHVPEYALVATAGNDLVGYVLLAPITLTTARETHRVLILAPVAVLPAWQRRGIGSQLIDAVLDLARARQERAVIVVGHADYYPRFGFRRASTWGLTVAFPVPDENFMAMPLQAGGLDDCAGQVIFPPEFGI